MRKLIFLLLTVACFAQPGTTVKQWTFNQFGIDSVTSVATYLLDAENFSPITKDHKGSLDLTNNNTVGDSVIASPIIEGGTMPYFNGTSQHLSLADASADPTLEFLTSWSAYAWVQEAAGATTESIMIASKVQPSGAFQGYVFSYKGNPGQIRTFIGQSWYLSDVIGELKTTPHFLGVTFNVADSILTFYHNGEKLATTRKTTSRPQANTGDFYIGRYTTTFYGLGYIANVYLDDSVLSEKQMADAYGLSTGWVSKAGNVSRDSAYAWYQTFDTDTLTTAIGVASTLSAGQEWYVTLTAKAKTSADTLDIYFVNKSSTQRKRVGTSWTTFTLPMGNGYNLAATDSIAIGGGSDFDFDNVIVSKASHHLIRNINRWITW